VLGYQRALAPEGSDFCLVLVQVAAHFAKGSFAIALLVYWQRGCGPEPPTVQAGGFAGVPLP
jgi:hypothetical protein